MTYIYYPTVINRRSTPKPLNSGYEYDFWNNNNINHQHRDDFNIHFPSHQASEEYYNNYYRGDNYPQGYNSYEGDHFYQGDYIQILIINLIINNKNIMIIIRNNI